MVGKKPQFSFSSFTVLIPEGDDDFAVFFYPNPNVFEDIKAFMITTLTNSIGSTQYEAKKASIYVENILKGLAFKTYD